MNQPGIPKEALPKMLAMADLRPMTGGNSELERLLSGTGLALTVLPPSVKSQGAGTCIWVHDQRLTLIQRFRAGVYEELGESPAGGARVGARYAMSCDSLNYHLVLARESGAIAACLRLRVHPPKTTASGLKLFESIRRMPPAEGVRCTVAINAALAEVRPRGLAVGEISEVAVAAQTRGLPALRVLALGAAGLMRCLGDALVFARSPLTAGTPHLLEEVASPLLPRALDGAPAGSFEILHFDSTRLPAAVRPLVDEIKAHLLQTHPHIKGLEASFEDDRDGIQELRRLLAG